MLLEIEGRRYPVRSMEDLQLRHVAQLQQELAANPGLTSAQTWGDIRRLVGEWGNLSAKARQAHPEGIFLTCLTVWAARVLSGEDLSLLEAVSVPVSAIRWIVEPGDRQAGEGEGKARTRPSGSGGAGRRGGSRKMERR